MPLLWLIVSNALNKGSILSWSQYFDHQMSNCIPCHEIEGKKFLQPDNRDGVRILSATAVHISCTRNSCTLPSRKSTVAVFPEHYRFFDVSEFNTARKPRPAGG